MAIVDALAGKLAEVLSRNWWVLLLRGVAAILFGILTFVQPGITLASLVMFFGAYALADGVLAAWTAISPGGDQENRFVLMIESLLGIGVGLVSLFNPGVTTLVFGLLFVVLAFKVKGVAARLHARAA
jgi:uncharacterized membrane protein HdeD (DUF308 family)